MTAVLLAVHVLAAIVFIGPVTVAASLFPRYARQGEVGVARVLHRISRVYAVLGWRCRCSASRPPRRWACSGTPGCSYRSP
jgi:hypothetical protein